MSVVHYTKLMGVWLSLIAAATISTALGQDASLDPHLEPLRPWLGKVWKGELKKGDGNTTDIARWERALNGKAVRILHSVNDGVYGGESIVMWDESKKAITYYYFTTAGFVTHGTMTVKDGIIYTREVVTGQGTDVSEVRGQTQPPTNGTFRIKTEYLKKGQWTPGRDSTYRETPEAQVRFK